MCRYRRRRLECAVKIILRASSPFARCPRNQKRQKRKKPKNQNLQICKIAILEIRDFKICKSELFSFNCSTFTAPDLCAARHRCEPPSAMPPARPPGFTAVLLMKDWFLNRTHAMQRNTSRHHLRDHRRHAGADGAGQHQGRSHQGLPVRSEINRNYAEMAAHYCAAILPGPRRRKYSVATFAFTIHSAHLPPDRSSATPDLRDDNRAEPHRQPSTLLSNRQRCCRNPAAPTVAPADRYARSRLGSRECRQLANPLQPDRHLSREPRIFRPWSQSNASPIVCATFGVKLNFGVMAKSGTRP
jgi:hypothetical protein